MSGEGIVARVGQLADIANDERKEERIFAATNSIAHYVFGIAGIVGGAVAAATASGSPTWIPVAAGITAAIGSGLATFFKFEDKARRRFVQERRYKSVVEHATNEHSRLLAEEVPPAEAARALADIQERLDKVRAAAQP